MVTREKSNIFKPKNFTREKLNIFKPKTYLIVIQNYEPTSVEEALLDPKWRMAMKEEFTALERNQI